VLSRRQRTVALPSAGLALTLAGAGVLPTTSASAAPTRHEGETAGGNTIRLVPTTASGLPNVDQLDFEVGTTPPPNGKQVERLDRGLVSVRSGSGNLVSWRLPGTDPADVTFNMYRDSTRIYAGSLLGNGMTTQPRPNIYVP
jgi:hypothetical protein